MQKVGSRTYRPFLPIWRAALGDKSGATFAEFVAPHVRLEGSIYATPIEGREKVWASMSTAGGITSFLRFTQESASHDRIYLEWEEQALGQRFSGVTVLTFGGSGLIDNVALHYRPLGAVLAFSAEMGRRLGDSVGPGVFYRAPQTRLWPVWPPGLRGLASPPSGETRGTSLAGAVTSPALARAPVTVAVVLHRGVVPAGEEVRLQPTVGPRQSRTGPSE